MYGAQTSVCQVRAKTEFENDVEMYGAQTFFLSSLSAQSFENDVEMYGAQTQAYQRWKNSSLRMM